MGGMFSKPKQPDMPKVPPPPAIPEVGGEVEDAAMKAARRRRGFSSTVLAGTVEPDIKKKTLLG